MMPAEPATPEQVAEIRQRLAAVTHTKGWRVKAEDAIHFRLVSPCPCCGVIASGVAEWDARFLAHAPEDVAALLAHVDQQAAEIARLQALMPAPEEPKPQEWSFAEDYESWI